MRTSRPLLLSPFFVSALSAFGQWTDPAGNITSTTAGTVGIGTATPSTKLTVSASGGFNTFGAAQFNLRNSVSGAVFAQQVTDSGLWQLADVGSGATKILVAAGVNGTIDFSPGPETRSSAGVGVSASVPPRSSNSPSAAGTGPIRIGDLLATSAISGTAMRSEPMDIRGRRFHQPGTIIGKALEPLDGSIGEILVLLSMQ